MEQSLVSQIRTITTTHAHIRFYVFGSSLKSHKEQNDIDILIIYKNAQEPKMIRELLDASHLPIDMVFFTEEEEEELGFIGEVNASPII
ncbi:hypothetical protein KORDIASMS9_01273 [Kordia sp. SMS9]|uniref:nucleotidyltransferase domain-containing protein n=1 Tax=Kordia sp. SMS9 TaxID=2282170 RepID=UPI000E0DEF9F|nr:nucleotidyltransferase domain-containing protein [Kordia sp. SMS9]AXG69054.1 hypothetical protein KORDIASMS9_01273 [Kordia sp. SMS9]